MRSTAWILAFCLWSSVLSAAPVLAENAVLAPPNVGDERDAAYKTARVALAEALSMQGLTVIDYDLARRQLAPSTACTGNACCARLLAAEVVDLAATVAVARDDDGELARIIVSLTDHDGHHYETDAAIESGDLRAATTRALLEARGLQLLGPGPWLRVDGGPDGARVLLDGRVVGSIPYRACIAPGSYTLRVEAAGYVSFEQALVVPDAHERKHVVEVTLTPGAIETSTRNDSLLDTRVQEAPSEDDASWMLVPAAIGVTGLAIAAVTSVRLASGLDSCVRADADKRCTEERRVQLAPTLIYYSLSAALIGTSIVWLVLGSDDDTQEGARASLGLGHVELSGRF